MAGIGLWHCYTDEEKKVIVAMMKHGRASYQGAIKVATAWGWIRRVG